MQQELILRIILLSPPSGVDYGLQKGSGSSYETVQKRQSAIGDLLFTFTIGLKQGKDGQPDFSGPFVQGPAGSRFVYLDIGTYAGVTNSIWGRRLKVPLRDITQQLVEQATKPGYLLETRVPGTGKDGTPTCATVKPFDGWRPVKE